VAESRLGSVRRTSIAIFHQFAHSDGSTVTIHHRSLAHVFLSLDRERDKVIIYGSDDLTLRPGDDGGAIPRVGKLGVEWPIN
jgi:hypothetical protein